MRGTFDADGFQATLERGQLETLQDAAVVTQSRLTLPVKFGSDGTSVVGRSGSELPPGEFLTESLLSDEQQRRQRFLRYLLASDDRSMAYPNVPSLMAWTSPIDVGFELPHKEAGAALVTIPIELTRPESGTKIAIPAPFLTYNAVFGAKGGYTSVFKNSNGLWASSSAKGTTVLRFQVPPELLPIQPNSATLKLTITAPSRVVKISAGLNEDLQEIASKASPVGAWLVPITDELALKLDAAGSLHVSIEVGDVEIDENRKGEYGTRDQNWRIDYVQLDMQATIE